MTVLLLVVVTCAVVAVLSGGLSVLNAPDDQFSTVAARLAVKRHKEAVEAAESNYTDLLLEAKKRCVDDLKQAHQTVVQLGKFEEALQIEQIIDRLEKQVEELQEKSRTFRAKDLTYDALKPDFPGDYMWAVDGGHARPYTFLEDGTYRRTDTGATGKACVWTIRKNRLLIQTKHGVAVFDRMQDADHLFGKDATGTPMTLTRVEDDLL